MKKTYFLSLLLYISFGAFCQEITGDGDITNKKDSLNKQQLVAKRSDMFGLHILRGLKINSNVLPDGYIIFAVPNSPLVYLLNLKGEVVHQWKGNYNVFHAQLQKDGSLIVAAIDPDFPVFGFGGPYGRIQKISWDSKLLWNFEYSTERYIVHHDFDVMPNGHILALAYEATSYKSAILNGRKPEKTPKSGPWLEKIIEIAPQGKTGGKIVWEWHVGNHLIQDFDSTKANYDKPADHPELLDFNRDESLRPIISQNNVQILKGTGLKGRNATADNGGSDVFHFNSIKYNSDLDQIVFSSLHLNEIFIIDHSTTTAEAAGHKGGRRDKGGDFLYRWGNPQNYQRGDSTNRQLFGQHDARWIEKGMQGAGNLTIFNNDINYMEGRMNYSAIYEIAPPMDNEGNYYLEKNNAYGPAKPAWTYMSPDTISFHSNLLSGAQRIENGNTFINDGLKGHFFEVTQDGKIVWEYFQSYRGGVKQQNQDSNPAMRMIYSTFRANFIPANHSGLANIKLEPLKPQPEPFIFSP